MRTQLLIITALSGLLLAGPLLAASRYETGGWKTSDRCFCNRGECVRQNRADRMERQEFRKSMKHRKMATQHQRQAMRHRDFAWMHGQRFRSENFGPQMGPVPPMGPMAQGPHPMQFRNPQCAPGRPDCPVGPPREMRFKNRQFGPNQAPNQGFGPHFQDYPFDPNQAPDQPFGPRKHMRLRDGTGPRAL